MTSHKRIKIHLHHYKKRNNKSGTFPLYYRLTLNGRSTDISTGVFVKPEDFKGGKIIESNNILKLCQIKLDMIGNRLVEIETDLIIVGESVAPHKIKNVFKSNSFNKKYHFTDIASEWLSNREKLIGVEFGAKRQIEVELGIERFIKFLQLKYNRTDFGCQEIKEFVINDFRLHVLGDLKIPSMFRRYFFSIKSIINFAIMKDYTEKNYLKNYKVKRPKTNVIAYLSLEQLKILTEAKFNNGSLERIQDLFLFQCYTGMAYSDLAKFSIADIVQQNSGQKFIIIHRQKTSNKSTIPMLPEAETIINKYVEVNALTIKHKVGLPVISNQVMNRLLKKIALICNLPTELLTTRVARRTFASTVINSGLVSIETISKMLGHSQIDTTQNHYAHIDTKKIIREMQNFSFTNLINN